MCSSLSLEHEARSPVKHKIARRVQRPCPIAAQLKHMGVVLQYGGPVGDADHRSATGAHPLVERGFVGAVQRAGRLVQYQQAWIANKGSPRFQCNK